MTLLIWFCAVALVVHLSSIILVLVWRSTRHEEPLPSRPPAVTIVRPVCGLENNLETTLQSTFRLDWPDYEIIFCVATANDPAIAIVRRCMASHPHIPARLLVGDDRISVNPKLNNVIKGWRSARYDWIVLADSNVLMPEDYIRQLFARWLPGTGAVCSPPIGSAPEGFAAELECAWLNGFQARWQLLADAIGLGFAQGKTMLLNRQIMARAGGFERLGEEVAEDAATTGLIRGLGLKVRLVKQPFPQPLGRRDLASVWKRQLRWARLRRASFPLYFVPELIAGAALPLAALTALVATGTCSPLSALLYLVAWYGGETLLNRSFGWHTGLLGLPATVARDIALPVLWIAAWFGNGFVWRGNAMTVASDETTETPPAKARLRRVMDKTRERAKTLTVFRN
ncbi:glycosyltransferase [Rhizobium daejeonense]|uniref:Glycosyltransferase n=1 Tax=Rhizobium daejeonense TaxID=240521 RepID=A0A6M1RTF5_9HYPH|nr:ceramide glucosyltransferase [Rhizobium daejeonense]NGO62339.1 glycosyltransferase [Rhizobium daejeonense]